MQQLRSRWGRDGARVIMDTSGTKIWLPGISDPDTLQAASTLCGTAAMREHGQDHNTRHPVMTPEIIRQLPAGYALVVRGGMSPVIARLPMCWKDPAYRAARRTGHAVARPVPARQVAALPPAVPHLAPPAPPAPPDDELDPADVIPFPATLNGGTRYPWDE